MNDRNHAEDAGGSKPPLPRRSHRNKNDNSLVETFNAIAAGFAGAVSAAMAERRTAQLSGTIHDLRQCCAGFACPIHGEYNRKKAAEMKRSLQDES